MRNLRLLLRFMLADESNCVDVGANVGDVLEELVTFAPAGKHYAFEPLPELATRLAERYPNVEVHQCALSNEERLSSFTRAVGTGSAHAYSGLQEQAYPSGITTETFAVTTRRLDDVLPATYTPAVIKIDVEGGELDVMRGGRRTLETHRPLVVFEHHAAAAPAYECGPEDVHAFLDGIGMRVFDIDGNGPYSAADMRPVFNARTLWTWVAK
jgi:FkbM family methyltransferase